MRKRHSSGDTDIPGSTLRPKDAQQAFLEEAGDRRGRAPRTALTCQKPSSSVLPAYNEKAITVRDFVSAGSPVIGTGAVRGKNEAVKGIEE